MPSTPRMIIFASAEVDAGPLQHNAGATSAARAASVAARVMRLCQVVRLRARDLSCGPGYRRRTDCRMVGARSAIAGVGVAIRQFENSTPGTRRGSTQ